MLNKQSITLLQAITNITNSAIITYPVTTITNVTRDVNGNIDFSKVDPDGGWEEFGIFDLTSFLSSLQVLEEPTITLTDGIITAKDTDSSINFVTSSPASLEDFTTDPQNITSSVAAASIVEANIDVALITKIRKGVSIFKNLKDIFVVKNSEGVFLRTGNKESFSRNDNSYKIKLDTTLNEGKDFELAIPVDNFLSLPSIDFTLKVKYNEAADAHRVTVENSIFQFVLSIKA